MKKLAVFLLLIPTILCAQKFLVRFNTDTNRGFPVGWPIEAAPTDDKAELAPGWDDVLTKDKIDVIASQLRPELARMESARIQSIQTADNAKKRLLSDLFDDFQTFEDGWRTGTNYNVATLQLLIRKHNGALLLLKPILHELYESRQ